MVNYPDLSNLNNGSGISGLMALPNSSYPYFWGWILGGIWLIMVLSMYFTEKLELGKTRLLSSMAVSCLAILFLGTMGTIAGIITVEIMVYTLVLSLVVIGIWFFSVK